MAGNPRAFCALPFFITVKTLIFWRGWAKKKNVHLNAFRNELKRNSRHHSFGSDDPNTENQAMDAFELRCRMQAA